MVLKGSGAARGTPHEPPLSCAWITALFPLQQCTSLAALTAFGLEMKQWVCAGSADVWEEKKEESMHGRRRWLWCF